MSHPLRMISPPLFTSFDLRAARTGAQNDTADSPTVTIPRDRYLEITAWTVTVQNAAGVGQSITDPTIVCKAAIFAFVPGGPFVPPIITTPLGACDGGMTRVLVRPGDQIKASWQGLAAGAVCAASLTGVWHLL
jgi:hypothetical protein